MVSTPENLISKFNCQRKTVFPFMNSVVGSLIHMCICWINSGYSHESLFLTCNNKYNNLFVCLCPGCRTGEAKLTKGFNLAARFIIHTVGPKYKAKYRTAAESSLYSCYRNIMQLAA